MELIVTDQRSYRSEEPTYRAEAQEFMSDDFPALMPQEVLDILQLEVPTTMASISDDQVRGERGS